MPLMTPPQQTTQRLVFYKCRLGRRELDRLFAVASEGTPVDSVNVSTQRANTRFRQPSIGELVDAVEQANVPGDRDVWSNLALEAGDIEGARYIRISIDLQRAEVEVSGEDATWVYGQAARLRELFIEHADPEPGKSYS